MKGRTARGGETTEMMAEALRQIRQLTKHGASTLEVKFLKEKMVLHSLYDLQTIS